MNTQEIREEYEAMSSFDFRSYKGGTALYDSFGGTSDNKGFRYIGARKEKAFGYYSVETSRKFLSVLLESGNIEYSRKVCNIGYYRAIDLVFFFNSAAKQRGLSEIYSKRKKRTDYKITKRQVSIIKYLLGKGYTMSRLSRIYNVSYSLIFCIKNNTQYGLVDPIIKISETATLKRPFFLGDNDVCESLLSYIIYEGCPKCPFCSQVSPYVLSHGRYRCSNLICKKDFSKTTRTPLENCKLPADKVVAAMYLYLLDSKINTFQIALAIKCTQKTGFLLLKRIKLLYMTTIWKNFILNYKSFLIK